MSNLFDLEHELERVKHKSIKGFVESKSLARSYGNRPSNNRLLSLEQSLSPITEIASQASLATAFTIPELTIFNQYYTLACGTPKQKNSNNQETDLREIIRIRMLYLMPIYWKAYDPKAKAKDLPSYNMVWKDVKNAFEGQKMKKKILYSGNLSEQVKVWEVFLWESREALFNPEGTERKMLEQDFSKLVTDYLKQNKTKEFISPPVFKFNGNIESLNQFNPKITKNAAEVDLLKVKVFKEMNPASLGYTYLEWYDDEELNPILPEEVKKLYSSLANLISESTLTAPKDKKTGQAKNEDYKESFKLIVEVITEGFKNKGNRSPITKIQINSWSSEQQKALTEQLFGLQAGLGSLYQLLKGGQEIDIGQLKNLVVKITSKAEIAETGLDILALTNASFDTFNGCVAENVSNVNIGVSNFVTDSAWANSLFAPAIITLGGTIHKMMTTDWKELDLKSIAGIVFTTSLRLTRAAAQTAMFIKNGNKAWGIKPIKAGAKVSSEVAGIVTGSIGVFLNARSAYKELEEIAKLGGISGRFEGVIEINCGLKKHLDVKFHKGLSRHKIENDDYEAFDVILQKMHHRRSYSAIRYTGAIAGIGSGVTAITIQVAALTAVTLANAWNPVGWVLAITSTVAGLGFLSYTGGRKLYKMMRLKGLKKKVQKKNGHVPDFCKTTGDYWRFQAATMIYYSSIASRNTETLQTYPAEALYRIAVGRAFANILLDDPGKNKEDNALDTAFEMGVPGIMQYIKG